MLTGGDLDYCGYECAREHLYQIQVDADFVKHHDSHTESNPELMISQAPFKKRPRLHLVDGEK